VTTSTFQVEPRSYGELCPIALALDLVGERWTLLILRELYAGPKRFTDLASGLPGIGTAILSERLKQLEKHGVLHRRRLRPPAPAVLYELSERGLALEPVMNGLSHWGAAYLGDQDKLTSRGRWLLQAMASNAYVPRPKDIETTNFVLDGQESHILVGKQRVGARDGLHGDARITIRGTTQQLYSVLRPPRKAASALRGFAVEGDRASAERLLSYLQDSWASTQRQAGAGRRGISPLGLRDQPASRR
jgi:DNA-binding HxlR family transcriptional regulator